MKKIYPLLILILFNSFFAFDVEAQVGIITTVVGNGTAGYPTEGVPATSTPIPGSSDVALDKYGNLYIAVSYAILKKDTFGNLHTIAGYIGTPGFSGDGGPASSAQLYAAWGVAVDDSGNVYIADTYNNRIRKVNTAGIINTIAGNDTASYGGDGGPAIIAKLNNPTDIALDHLGNIYFTDRQNHRVRKINTAGVISTVAGNGVWGYTGDGGPATTAQLFSPTGLTVDDTGNIYIADNSNCRIRKVNTAGIISTIAGTSTCGYSGDGIPAVSSNLSTPWDVAIDKNGNIFISDETNQRIRKINTSGIITTIAGTGFGAGTICAGCYSGDGGPATSAKIRLPLGIIIDSTGNNIYYADGNDRVRRINFGYGIGVSPLDSVCAGTSVTFYANSVAGCATPSYQWHLNGAIVAGATSNTYSYTPSNGDSVRCVMSCAGGGSYNSSTIRMTVRPVVNPTNHIATFTGDTVCAGTLVTFLSTTTFAGTAPIYNWYVNGSLVTSGSSAAYAYIPSNGDNVYCSLVSSIPCASPAVRTSNFITMHVNPIITPMVTISCTPNDTVCSGTPVTFTASSIGGGSMPGYQWKVNGIIASSGYSSYTYVPSPGDSVKCTLMSSSSCATATTATSNVIGLYVIPAITPVIAITSFPGDTVCAGTTVTIVAATTGGGSSPVYQWRKNGFAVGSSVTYSFTPVDGDSVRCIFTSSAVCAVGVASTSSSIHFVVKPYSSPAVAITVTPSDTVCEGDMCVFNAIPVLGGATPFFQWRKNGVAVGTGGSMYSYYPSTGDSIICFLTSSDLCATPPTVFSNKIGLNVEATLAPTISLSAPASAAASTIVTVNATISGGGSTYVIVWMNHGITFNVTTVPEVSYVKSAGPDIISAIINPTTTGCFDTGISNVVTINVSGDAISGSPSMLSASSIYPNPATDELTIKTADTYSSFSITNSIGQIMLQQPLSNNVTTVNVKALPPGLYIVSLEGEEGREVMRFLKR